MTTEADLRPLTVTVATPVARDIFPFELRDPGGGELPAFAARARLTVRVPSGALRKYSLCSDPAERERCCSAVKRDAAGRGDRIMACCARAVSPELVPDL